MKNHWLDKRSRVVGPIRVLTSFNYDPTNGTWDFKYTTLDLAGLSLVGAESYPDELPAMPVGGR